MNVLRISPSQSGMMRIVPLPRRLNGAEAAGSKLTSG